MNTAYKCIEGHYQVLRAFGEWPRFCGAAVHSLVMHHGVSSPLEDIAKARILLCLDAVGQPQDAQSQPAHYFVRLLFHEVFDVSLSGFSDRNALSELKIENCAPGTDVPTALRITLSSPQGFSGSFCARHAEVLSLGPDPKNAPKRPLDFQYRNDDPAQNIQVRFVDARGGERVISFVATLPHWCEGQSIRGDLFDVLLEKVFEGAADPIPIGSRAEAELIEHLRQFVERAIEDWRFFRRIATGQAHRTLKTYEEEDALSTVWFLTALEQRRQNRLARPEPGAAPNGGPGKRSGDVEPSEGPPSAS